MKIIYLGFLLVMPLLISAVSFAQKQHEISLVSPYFPPYTYSAKQQVVGIGPELIKRVFDHANIPYRVTMVVDYGAAVHVLKSKLADGMFLASQNSERDASGKFTLPLVINKWSWYVVKGTKTDFSSQSFKSRAGIGTIKGTNTAKWLVKNAYTIVAQPTEATVLAAMLKSGRIDAVFISEAVFEHALDAMELADFIKVVEVERPFGIYISHDYLNRYPESLDKINQSIELLRTN